MIHNIPAVGGGCEAEEDQQAGQCVHDQDKVWTDAHNRDSGSTYFLLSSNVTLRKNNNIIS